MDFAMSAKAQDYHQRLTGFMTEFVFPAEKDYDEYRAEAGPDDHTVPPIVEHLKKLAKERWLWNLFLPPESALTNRAIQVHGDAGVSDDVPLARLYSWHRAMRLFDGPDEVHMRTIARAELGKEKSALAAAACRQSDRAARRR